MSESEPPAEMDVDAADWGATQVVDGVEYTLGDGDAVGEIPQSDADVDAEVRHPTHPVSREGSTSTLTSTSTSTEVRIVGFRLENRTDEAVALPGPAAFELPGHLTPHSDAHHFSVTDPSSAGGDIRDRPLPSYFRLERAYGAADLPAGDTVSGLVAYLTDREPQEATTVSVVSHEGETLSWRVEGDEPDEVDASTHRSQSASGGHGNPEESSHRREKIEGQASQNVSGRDDPESDSDTEVHTTTESDDDTPETTPASERASIDAETANTGPSTPRHSDRPDDPASDLPSDSDSDPDAAFDSTAVDEGVTTDEEDTAADDHTPGLDDAQRNPESGDHGLPACPECEDVVYPDHDYCGNCGAALSE